MRRKAADRSEGCESTLRHICDHGGTESGLKLHLECTDDVERLAWLLGEQTTSTATEFKTDTSERRSHCQRYLLNLTLVRAWTVPNMPSDSYWSVD